MTVQNLTSVIIVTYHTGPILNQVIDAVLAQNANIELVLINNGNPPEVEAALMERYKDDPAVRLMTGHGNIGLARGYNLGARVAAGEDLLFLGHKCRIPPNTVARLHEEKGRTKKLCVFGPRLVDPSGTEVPASRRALLTPQTAIIEGTRLYRHYPATRLRLHEEKVPSKTAIVPAISSHFMFMARKAFDTLEGFCEDYFYGIEDFDFCYRLYQRGGIVAFVPDLVVMLYALDEPHPDPQRELYKAKGLVRYFHETYSDSLFQPFLWFLYFFIWVRYAVKVLLAGKVPTFTVPIIPALPSVPMPIKKQAKKGKPAAKGLAK